MKKLATIVVFLIVYTIQGKAEGIPGVGLFTDRDMYVSGDVLLAKLYTPVDNTSRIAYLDLVNERGIRISGVSLEIKNNQADGYLQLPDSLSSGIYVVRSYLKQDTQKPKVLHEIWISNRFDRLEKTTQMNRVSAKQPLNEVLSDQISIQGLESFYSARSSVQAKILVDPKLLNQIDGDLMVTVAQTESSFGAASFLQQSHQPNEELNEERGIVISGTVTNKKTSLPASGITVYLTIPDSIPGFQYFQTKSDGRFRFLLDQYYGSIQVVIQCFSEDPSSRLKIKMDEFMAGADALPDFQTQAISEKIKTAILQNIDAVTFQKVFNQSKLRTIDVPVKRKDGYPYYGIPSYSVDPQLFVDLPDFTEVSRELLPGVKFRNYNNEPSLQVINNPMRAYFNEMPLLLIDGIPVRDLNLIKKMGSTDIDRIDVCQSERFYGDLRFPGVVAMYTTKADYSLLPESDQLLRLKFETIQLPHVLAEPVISEPNIPDLRQILYWTPSVTKDKELPVNFSNSSVTGEFKLVVRARLKDGTLISSKKQFEVK